MSKQERLFKVLNEDGTPYHGGHGAWSLPTDDAPGEWMPPIEGDLVACQNGYHLCRREDLLEWLGPAIFEAECRGERVDANDKVVVRQARLVRRLKWDERVARLFACDCAERVLPLFEAEYPEDDRPCRAIETARRYAVGDATCEELDAAGDAAWAAARDTVWDAAWAAARAVARDTVWAAARDAAGGAAWAAAEAATWDATGGAARVAEQGWQTVRLLWYLDGELQ